MPLDRQRAGVESLCQEVRAQADDLLRDLERHGRRRAVRAARAWREARLTFGAVPSTELVQPAAVHAMRACELANAASLAQMCLDQVPPDVHPETPSPWCLRCLDTSVAELSPIS